MLAAGDKARELCERPAWIRGIDHRIEPHALGLRDLTRSVSTEQAAANAGVADGPVDIAELHAPFTHQEVILRKALGLGDGTAINPSGGALSANWSWPPACMRFGEAASRITRRRGRPGRGPRHLGSVPAAESGLRPGG